MPRRTEEFESGESNEEMKNFYQSVNPIHIGLTGAVWYQPYVHNELWKMSFGAIIYIHKMSQKVQKIFARRDSWRRRLSEKIAPASGAHTKIAVTWVKIHI